MTSSAATLSKAPAVLGLTLLGFIGATIYASAAVTVADAFMNSHNVDEQIQQTFAVNAFMQAI